MTVAGHGPGSEESFSGGKLLSQVPVRLVDDFLREYDNCRDSVLSDTGPIRKYITARAEDELTECDIRLASRSENGERPSRKIGDRDIVPLERSIGPAELKSGILAISGKRSRVASRGVEKTGVMSESAKLAEVQYRKDEKKAESESVNYPDWIYRAVRQRPLLEIGRAHV